MSTRRKDLPCASQISSRRSCTSSGMFPPFYPGEIRDSCRNACRLKHVLDRSSMTDSTISCPINDAAGGGPDVHVKGRRPAPGAGQPRRDAGKTAGHSYNPRPPVSPWTEMTRETRRQLVTRRCRVCEWQGERIEAADADTDCPWCHAPTRCLWTLALAERRRPLGLNVHAAALGR